jgi:hypothetical protein
VEEKQWAGVPLIGGPGGWVAAGAGMPMRLGFRGGACLQLVG